MKFTIGIVHGEQTAEWANRIWKQFVPFMAMKDVQLILVGPEILNAPNRPHLEYIIFDEKLNGKAWITKKKNLITSHAKYENIVYMHDYIWPELIGWYKGWCQFGEDFKVANNIQLIEENGEHFRHSDWTINPYDIWALKPEWHWKFWDVALPYEFTTFSKLQYISGQYWVAKKSVMEEFPLDETLAWGDSEDVRWSEKVREKYDFSFNPHSIVYINKAGKWKPGLLDQSILKELCEKHNIPYTF